MSNRIILYSSEKEDAESLFIQDLRWSLDRYIGSEASKIRIALKSMDLDLGNGITIDSMLEQMNSRNCFDFDYKPIEKDRLRISNCADNYNEHKYFGLLFRDGKWVKGDYYTNKLQHKGMTIISKKIGEGKIKNIQQ
jgi:hypothetical protein